MVAPSFQSMEIVSETYTKNNRAYIDVRNQKTGTIRSVRWYTPREYAKQYGSPEEDPGFPGLKAARGFQLGPITLIRNWKQEDEEWLDHSNARYATDVGWYIVSTDQVRLDTPAHFRYLNLYWSEFSKDDTHPKSPEELSKIILTKEKRNEWV